MTAALSGDSIFIDEAGNAQPLFDSPFIAQKSDDQSSDDQSNDGGISANTAGTGLALDITIVGDSSSNVVTDQDEPLSDNVTTGEGNDIVNVGGGDDVADGNDGNDLMFGGSGDDTITGGQGADFVKGGQGADVFMIRGDAEDGAFGDDSDLVFDDQGRIIADFIFNFDDNGDQLVLQDLGLGTSVTYDDQTGAVIMTDDTGESYTIAYMQPGLDITTTEDGNGNFTLE